MLSTDRNCWAIEEASRASVIIDTADYFAAFAEACLAAEKKIIILGWDFDRHERLHRGDPGGDMPDKLGEFLAELTRRKPDLNIYLLSWDFNIIYAAEREMLPALRIRLQAPPRFHFRLDGHHPSGASHHQKIVVVDDRIAFVGGIDLSRWRWDTSEHLPEDERRIDPAGKPYPPFHDMMMLVEGKAAMRLGELARVRWKRSGGHKIKPADADPGHSPWPESVEPQLFNVPVAIARTEPAFRGRKAVEEVLNLYLDSIDEASELIYIENQYFTSHRLADALIEKLKLPQGPEIVIVLPRETGGWLEQMTMDVLRSRIVSRMIDADKHHRLRVYYPHQPGLETSCISVHSKLLIVDDRILRIGSSNTSNRSMGLDTECDLTIEAKHDNDAIHTYIRGLRHRLLAEHLDCSEDQIASAESGQHGHIAAIESLLTEQRSFRLLDYKVSDDLDSMVPDTGLIDPSEPYSADYFVAEYVPKDQRSTGRKRLTLFVIVILALFAMAAAWRWTPLQDYLSPKYLSGMLEALPSDELRALIAVGGFFIASLFMVPLTLLAIISGIVFSGWKGFLFILVGAVASSIVSFFMGRVLGKKPLEKLIGPKLEKINKRLSNRGIIAVALLRLVPISPFTVFNFIAGTSSLTFRQFSLGTLLGLSPGLGAITLFSDSIWGAIKAPSLGNFVTAAVVALVLVILAWSGKRWLRSS